MGHEMDEKFLFILWKAVYSVDATPHRLGTSIEAKLDFPTHILSKQCPTQKNTLQHVSLHLKKNISCYISNC
jgi:hypothetical protein